MKKERRLTLQPRLLVGYLTHYMTVVTMCTTLFNIKNLCDFLTQCICVFRMVLAINSDCFPKQH
jgi:hypothetical protein